MTPHPDRLRTELLAARYLEAVEADDFATQSRLWALAEADPDLVAAFREVHDDLIAEQTAREAGGLVLAIGKAVTEHLTSGEVVRDPTGPVTVGAVADELFRHTPGHLPADAHAVTDRLRVSHEPLPADLGLSKLTAWAEAKFGPAPPAFWKAFRDAALKLELRRAAAADYQLAARSAGPQNPRGDK